MSNTNNNLQTQTSNALHNAIMEVGGKDRPPMLAPVITFSGNPESRDTSTRNLTMNSSTIVSRIHPTNSNGLRSKFRNHYRRVHGELYDRLNDIYSQLMLVQQCSEFGKFTSRDGESLESYYSRFYKMMNELVRNQYDVTNHQIVSYHKLYDILKQHQNEVNKIRAVRLARTANPLALVAQQQLVYHPQNHPNHYTQNSLTRSQQAATRNRGKAIVNSPSPTYDQEPTMVAEDDALSKEKEIDKLMALIFYHSRKSVELADEKIIRFDTII
ncbi:hypothetical protein Tco_0365683 [Tanacetum coccineum]